MGLGKIWEHLIRTKHACGSFSYKDHPMVVVTGGYHYDLSISATDWTTEIWDPSDIGNDWKYLKEEFSNSKLHFL